MRNESIAAGFRRCGYVLGGDARVHSEDDSEAICDAVEDVDATDVIQELNRR